MAEISGAQHNTIDFRPDANSASWWEGLQRDAIVFQRCDECQLAWFPATPRCAHCGSGVWSQIESSGVGSLYSWIVVRRSLDAEFADDVPYVIATVELAEGPRIFARLFDVDPEKLQGELPVSARFYNVGSTRFVGFELQGDHL